jgi:hypothetical protein
MHKNAMKCNKTLSKWCKNKHGASKIIDKFETYQSLKKFGHTAITQPPSSAACTTRNRYRRGSPAYRVGYRRFVAEA